MFGRRHEGSILDAGKAQRLSPGGGLWALQQFCTLHSWFPPQVLLKL